MDASEIKVGSMWVIVDGEGKGFRGGCNGRRVKVTALTPSVVCEFVVAYDYIDVDDRGKKESHIFLAACKPLVEHDVSNPYLSPRDMVTCARCLLMWGKGAPPPPLPCDPSRVKDPRPGQAIIDGFQADVMEKKNAERKPEPVERARFEPMNGGATIITRGPWR